MRIGLEAAAGKNLLGDGIRLYDNPGGVPVRLHRIGDPMAAVNVRYRPLSG